MTSNAYQTQSGTLDKTVVELLIVGFLGQLKGWWDFHLTMQQQLDILNAILTGESDEPIFDQHGEPIQDAISTLIFTISLHFMGDSSHLRDKNANLLSILLCKKMSNFQSYKTTFPITIMFKEDLNQPFQKNKFYVGLLTLLEEKVRNKIRETYRNHIMPYN